MFLGLLNVSTRISNVESLKIYKLCNFIQSICQARATLVKINSSETLFYPFMVSVNICDGSCKNINDQYARVCILNKVKYINVKRFTLMP